MIKKQKEDKQRRKDLCYMAGLSCAAKQWHDCVEDFMSLFNHMREHLTSQDLNQQEKNIFNSSFKHVLEKGRRQWRTCFELFQKEEEADPDEETNYRLKCIKLMKVRIESEIRLLCKDQYLVCKHFMKTESANNSLECRVFYFKIMADTFRYLATIETNKTQLSKLSDECAKRYRAAIVEASELEATNPIRLSAGLNYAVFLAEI